MKIKFNIKGVIYGIILVLLIVGGFVFIPQMFTEQSSPVDYIMIPRESTPEKILDMMGKYQDEERALAVKIDGKIYVVVTRGKDKDHGIQIDKIQMVEDEGKSVMRVQVIHKDKEDSYPYIVAETNLKELPNRIELNSKTIEEKK